MLIVTRLRNPGAEPWLQFRFINFPGQSSNFRSLEHSGKEQQGSVQDEWLPVLPPLVRSLFCTKDLGNPFIISSSSTCSSVRCIYHSHISAASKKPLHAIESFMHQRKVYSRQSWTRRWPTGKFNLPLVSKFLTHGCLEVPWAFIISKIYRASFHMAKPTAI